MRPISTMYNHEVPLAFVRICFPPSRANSLSIFQSIIWWYQPRLRTASALLQFTQWTHSSSCCMYLCFMSFHCRCKSVSNVSHPAQYPHTPLFHESHIKSDPVSKALRNLVSVQTFPSKLVAHISKAKAPRKTVDKNT